MQLADGHHTLLPLGYRGDFQAGHGDFPSHRRG
jgi:hypothetical protein